jgi:PHD/YefM family antitoxin component YafN of YafNO toxin-antitoxin module
MGQSFRTLNTQQATEILEELHDRVTQFNDRVILTRKGSDARCVLVSEAELEGLERAVEILSQTDDGAALRDHVLRVVGVVNQNISVSAHTLS